MSKFFHGMKVGVDKYGIEDFDNIFLDGTNYANHGDSQGAGKPVIQGFAFDISTLRHVYHGEIKLLDSPYVEYPADRNVTYRAKLDVDFPVTNREIEAARAYWMESKDLPVTPEERQEAINWLKSQTKFSVIDWKLHLVVPTGGLKGADIIKAQVAEWLIDLPDRIVTLFGSANDGQVRNFEAELIISKDQEEPQVFPIRETVLDSSGLIYLFLTDPDD